MKKLFFTVAAVIFILSACQNPLVSKPVLPQQENAPENKAGGSPDNVAATQGGKRSIELTWDEVFGAVRYNIFKADSPLVSFVQCAETTEARFNFSVPAGSTVYYRVSAVSSNGQESARSLYVMGSSLAQPIITDITDVTEASATVTWYMENDAAYTRDLRYTVYCFDKGGTEVAQLAIDGSQITQNRAVFTDLRAEEEYKYQVEAYLVNDQSNSEKSDIMDRKTARRLIPGAPENLSASRGTSTNTIELSFELPEEVNIALGADESELHQVYFVISKRFYSENANNDFLKVCSFFGSAEESSRNPLSADGSAVVFEGEYNFGRTVTWKDTGVIRGVEYEYQVQSYVDRTPNNERSKTHTPKTITADTSKATVTGWTLTEGNVSIGKPVYTTNAEGTLNVSATVPLNFNFNSKGEEYRYQVLETINSIEDTSSLNPDGKIERESAFLSYEQITAPYTASMNLTQKTTADSPGRGLYSYAVRICLPDGTEVDTVAAIGDVLVSEDVSPIVVENFFVQDGYTDKFRIKWDYVPDIKYVLYKSTDKTTWEKVDEYDDSAEEELKAEDYDWISPGVTVYFAMQPVKELLVGFETVEKKGQRVYLTEGSRTLGVPELLPVTGYSYSAITAEWKTAQKADTYRIKYKYAEEGWTTAAMLSSSELSPDITGTLHYSFKPDGYNNAAKAGKEMQIAVDAINDGLQKLVGGSEIAATSTEDVRARLVGPAGLAVQATQAAAAEYIEVSWNKAAGASGYYVFRRQFNMANSAEEREAIVYYIPAQESDTIHVTGKELTTDAEGTIIDTTTVKAAASFANSRYTLKDEYISDHEYSGGFARLMPVYKDQQNELAWGFPYRYFIVPVLSNEDKIEFTYTKDSNNKNTSIASYILRENDVPISYSGAAALEQAGFAIGFGQNVTATKGTYTVQGSDTNSGIQIKWNAPPSLAGSGFSFQYVVYRRMDRAGENWMPIITNTSGLSFLDNPTDKSFAYEYAVGIYKTGDGSNVFHPYDSQRFIAACKDDKDERGRYNMLGFTLDSVRMQGVSRNEQTVDGNFAEEVSWYSAGIKNTTYSDDTNWGIDGYTVFVMNRNIDGNWHEITDIPYANIPNQTNLSVKVAANTKFVDGRDLLRVMRDYKHYFKVRSYALNNVGDKVYCTDPAWDYEALFSQTTNRNNQDRADFLQDDYVKWGARQITTLEFTKIATLFMAWGLHNAAGGSKGSWWDMTESWKTTSNNGSSGRVGEDHNGSTIWWFYFDQYKPDLDTRANKGNWTYSTTFVKIDADNGSIWSWRMIVGRTTVSYQYPHTYSRDGDYGRSYISIVGPSCVDPLYNGQLRFADGNLTWTGGSIEVIYPMGTSSVQITGGGQVNTPLPFQSQSEDRRTALDEWY